MSKRVSNEKFQARIEKKHPGKYTFLSEYIDSDTRVHVIHNKCGHDDWVKPRYLTEGTGCGICRPSKPLSEEFINKYVSDMFPEYEYLGGYNNNTSIITVKHNCGQRFDVSAQTLLYRKNCNCPKCSNKNHNCFTGINDIETTDYWMFDLLVDKNYGRTHKSGSHEKTLFRCPTCGEKVKQIPYSVGLYGVNCPKCKTSISYPERFFANVLDQVGIEYEYQFSPEWSGRYRYDFKAILDNKYYIFELDGGFHYMYNNLSNKTIEEQIAIDMEKQKLAEDHGFIVIRIDCNYGGFDRFKYITENILKSDMSKIIDFSNVDFNLCNSYAVMHLVEIVANAWNEGKKTVNDLCEELKLSDTTVWRRLNDAFDNGLIKDSPEDIKLINRKASYKKYGHPRLNIIKCNETGEIFEGYEEPSKKYHANIGSYFCEEKRKFAGTLPDGTRLTWTKLQKNGKRV